MSRPGRRREDGGFSLVELSAAMMIFAVISAVIGTVTVGTFRAMRTVQVKISAGADARVAMESMSRTLRVAVVPTGESSAIVVGDVGEISFYALLSRTAATTVPLPTLVRYYRDSGRSCLMEQQTPARVLTVPSGTSIYAWDTGTTTKCLVRTSQVPSSADPWFAYYTSGQLLSGSPATPVPAVGVPTGGLALAVRQTVRSVQVTLTVSDPANPGVTGVDDEFRVTLGNVSLSNGGGA